MKNVSFPYLFGFFSTLFFKHPFSGLQIQEHSSPIKIDVSCKVGKILNIVTARHKEDRGVLARKLIPKGAPVFNYGGHFIAHESGFPHLLETLKNESTQVWKNHGILQKIIKIMGKHMKPGNKLLEGKMWLPTVVIISIIPFNNV